MFPRFVWSPFVRKQTFFIVPAFIVINGVFILQEFSTIFLIIVCFVQFCSVSVFWHILLGLTNRNHLLFSCYTFFSSEWEFRDPDLPDMSRVLFLWANSLWSGRQGSNLRPPTWKDGALPTELLPLIAVTGNYDIPTWRLTGACSASELRHNVWLSMLDSNQRNLHGISVAL